MLALEHTATGASTGQPSHVTTTTARHNEPHGDGENGQGGKHGTTTTQRVTTTTMRHCDDGHGRDQEKNKHCRPPSGGHDDNHH